MEDDQTINDEGGGVEEEAGCGRSFVEEVSSGRSFVDDVNGRVNDVINGRTMNDGHSEPLPASMSEGHSELLPTTMSEGHSELLPASMSAVDEQHSLLHPPPHSVRNLHPPPMNSSSMEDSESCNVNCMTSIFNMNMAHVDACRRLKCTNPSINTSNGTISSYNSLNKLNIEMLGVDSLSYLKFRQNTLTNSSNTIYTSPDTDHTGIKKESRRLNFIDVGKGNEMNDVWNIIIKKIEPYLDVYSILMIRQTCRLLYSYRYRLRSHGVLCFRGFVGYDSNTIFGIILPLIRRVLGLSDVCKIRFDFTSCVLLKDISVVRMLTLIDKMSTKYDMHEYSRNVMELVFDFCDNLTDKALEVMLTIKLPHLQRLSLVCCRNQDLTGLPFMRDLSTYNWPRFTKFCCSFSNIWLEAIHVVADYIIRCSSSRNICARHGRRSFERSEEDLKSIAMKEEVAKDVVMKEDPTKEAAILSGNEDGSGSNRVRDGSESYRVRDSTLQTSVPSSSVPATIHSSSHRSSDPSSSLRSDPRSPLRSLATPPMSSLLQSSIVPPSSQLSSSLRSGPSSSFHSELLSPLRSSDFPPTSSSLRSSLRSGPSSSLRSDLPPSSFHSSIVPPSSELSSSLRSSGDVCSFRPFSNCELEICGSWGSRKLLENLGFGIYINTFTNALKSGDVKLCYKIIKKIHYKFIEISNKISNHNSCLLLLKNRASELLVNCPITVNDPKHDVNVWTLPISIVITNGNIDIFHLLIKRGARVNIWDYLGKSPLYIACELGLEYFVNKMLKFVRPPDPYNKYEYIPLSISILNNDINLVKLLISNGVNLNPILPNIRNYKSPLYLACEINNIEIINLLLDAGADVNWRYHHKSTPTLLSYQNDYNWLPIFIKYGAGSNNNNRWVLTEVLSCAIIKDDELSISLLIKLYPSLLNNEHDIWSKPHIQASKLGKINILKLLLNHIDINNIDSYGMTALHVAAEEGHLDCMKLLIQSGALLNIQNIHGKDPLHLACLENKIDAVKLLLSFKCNPNIKEFNNGETPLMSCIKYRNESMALLLLKEAYNIDYELTDNLGRNSILYSLFFGQKSVLDFLMKKCPNTTITNCRGNTVTLQDIAKDKHMAIGSEKRLLWRFLNFYNTKSNKHNSIKFHFN